METARLIINRISETISAFRLKLEKSLAPEGGEDGDDGVSDGPRKSDLPPAYAAAESARAMDPRAKVFRPSPLAR